MSSNLRILVHTQQTPSCNSRSVTTYEIIVTRKKQTLSSYKPCTCRESHYPTGARSEVGLCEMVAYKKLKEVTRGSDNSDFTSKSLVFWKRRWSPTRGGGTGRFDCTDLYYKNKRFYPEKR